MCTEALFKSGYDTFIELGDAPDYIPYRKEYSLFEWMRLTQLERAHKLISLARSITGNEKDRLVKIITDTKAEHNVEKEGPTGAMVNYKCTCQVNKHETGTVVKIMGDTLVVKFPTRQGLELEVNALYAIEADADWDKLEQDVKGWFDDKKGDAENQENDPQR